jgi:hypothetical protein
MVYLSLKTFNFNGGKSSVMKFISTIFTVSVVHGRDLELCPKVPYPEQQKWCCFITLDPATPAP